METLTSTQSFVFYAIGIFLCLLSLVKLNKLGLEHGSLESQLRRIASNRVHTDRKGFKAAKNELAEQKKLLVFWVLIMSAAIALIITNYIFS